MPVAPTLDSLLVAADPLPLTPSPFERWILATRIVRQLAVAAWARGGFASSELTAAVPGYHPLAPRVAVLLGPEPTEPIVTVAPLLVIELAPQLQAQEWLARGVAAVWSLGADAVVVSTADGVVQRSPVPAALHLDGARGQLGPPLQLVWPLPGANGSGGRIG